ncbi:uncharacterized protein C2orf80-like protein [Anopheles sinensis]|uniref:Uncharacterized protein C2orf80-like protein n=1 Tax=Anopheles sinensis TaxID=74873 RepID=A0A084W6P1_ANOSI|nr:uncharacterized protein C2orf80-like protein [Anopheles sinensis]
MHLFEVHKRKRELVHQFIMHFIAHFLEEEALDPAGRKCSNYPDDLYETPATS